MVRPREAADTADGQVALDATAIRIERTVRGVLRGRVLWWRGASGGQRAWTLLRAGVLLMVFAWGGYNLSTRPGLATFELVTNAWMVVCGAAGILDAAGYLRDRTIRVDSVRDLHLDPDERALTIVHDDGGSPLPLSDAGPAETTLSLATADDVRTIRAALSRSGLADRFDPSEPVPGDEPTERVVLDDRFSVDRGVVFCGRCDAQVSPADSACPSCGYVFRVDRPIEAGTTIHAVD